VAIMEFVGAFLRGRQEGKTGKRSLSILSYSYGVVIDAEGYALMEKLVVRDRLADIYNEHELAIIWLVHYCSDLKHRAEVDPNCIGTVQATVSKYISLAKTAQRQHLLAILGDSDPLKLLCEVANNLGLDATKIIASAAYVAPIGIQSFGKAA
jgi:hypothetical protein